MDRTPLPLVILWAWLVTSCASAVVQPHETEVEHPTPAPSSTAAPIDTRLGIVSRRTPHGQRVKAPLYLVERRDLFQLALQEIDAADFRFVRDYEVLIVAPGQEEGVDHEARVVRIAWRRADHLPKHRILPNVIVLADRATREKFDRSR